MKKKKDKPKKRKGFLTVLIFFIVWTLWSWVPVTERIELDICGVDDPNDLTMEQWTKQIDEAFSKTEL